MGASISGTLQFKVKVIIMKSVLIITYYFPPMTDIGGLRLYGLAKFLHTYNWDPIILTSPLPGNPDPRLRILQTPYDDVVGQWKKRLGVNPKESLNTQFNVSSKKDRLSVIDRLVFLPGEIITYPDEKIGWYDYAVRAGDELLQREHVDLILSSAYPETSHLIARTLAEKYNIPWVADLRDLWTQNPYVTHCAVRNFFERKLELRTLGKANALVTVSEPLAADLQRLHTHTPVHVIKNGFNPDDACYVPPALSDKFTITYTGVLYNGKRDPAMLFEALENLVSEGIMDPDRVEVRFFGSQDPWLFEEIRQYHLEGVVTVNGPVPRSIALKRQRESQLLLLLLWDNPQDQGVYTGKVFEYLAARRPILAVGGPDRCVVESLLMETGTGEYIRSIEELKHFLRDCYNEFKEMGRVPYAGEEEKIMQYSQETMAKEFSDLFDTVVF